MLITEWRMSINFTVYMYTSVALKALAPFINVQNQCDVECTITLLLCAPWIKLSIIHFQKSKPNYVQLLK